MWLSKLGKQFALEVDVFSIAIALLYKSSLQGNAKLQHLNELKNLNINQLDYKERS
ncbi:hypothetical protein [Scytonema sp. PRP1]|uniref:hypothetical protein n=1 Tax=Scytonema sp. PRP1 TaxID=3120513 RepID=UPI002FD6D06D